MATLAPNPVMEPGAAALHAANHDESPAVPDEEREAPEELAAAQTSADEDDQHGSHEDKPSGKKLSQRQRLSEACTEALSTMHDAKPDAAGFYKDEIIAAVKARHGYTDKPEIYQIVLGDNKVFSREVGTRKQGVKQGRPRTLYSLVSLKGPPRPSSPSPTRQNIKEASPESTAVEAGAGPAAGAEKEKENAPAPAAPAVDADADADADAEGRTNRPRRAAANREQQLKKREEEEARIEEALKEEEKRRRGEKKARGRPPKSVPATTPAPKRAKTTHAHPPKHGTPGLADAADILLDLASNENSPAASGEHEGGMVPASPLGSPIRRRRTSATDSDNEAQQQQQQHTNRLYQPTATRVRFLDEPERPDVHAEMNLNTPRGRHFDFAAAAAAARSVADASAGSVDGVDAVAKDAAVALIMANDAKGEKQLRKALEAQNRAITALLADREVRSATVNSLCLAVENIAEIAAARQQEASVETRRAAAAIAAPTFHGQEHIRDARRELDQMRTRMTLELEKISARLDQGLR